MIIRDGGKEHYLSIRYISRLLHGSKYDRGICYCKKCYCSFRTPEILNNKPVPLCKDTEKALTIMPKKDKNDIVKFKDTYMELLQPFMIISDFETYTNQWGIIKPYSFAMFTYCIFDNEKTIATRYTGNNILDKFFDSLIVHVEYIDKSKSKPNPHSSPEIYNSNPEFAICLACNKTINDQYNAHGYIYYCKKTGYLLGFKHKECRDPARRVKDVTVQ